MTTSPLFAQSEKEVIALAEDAGRWLLHQAIETPAGLTWPDDALNPDDRGYDLAAGDAGKVVFFTALHEATGDERYLDIAIRGADHLSAMLETPDLFDGNSRKASLYSGVAGIGTALTLVDLHLQEKRYASAVAEIAALLETWSSRDELGLRWNETFNDLLYGDAGTALFLAYAASAYGNADMRDQSLAGAHALVARAEREQDGLWWYFRRDRPFNLPNFSHGTAGVAYTLATIGSMTNDNALKRAAAGGFRYLQSIAELDNEMFRIPYGWPEAHWEGLYEFGWAHGITGTGLLTARLSKAGIETTAANAMLGRIAETLASIGLPGTVGAPFAEPSTPIDYRFGRAGTLAFAGHLRRIDPYSTSVTELCDGLFQHIAAAAIRDGDTAHWQVEAPAFMGGGQAAYTGLFHGAAGIGLALLHLHAGMRGVAPYVALPDDPFTWPIAAIPIREHAP